MPAHAPLASARALCVATYHVRNPGPLPARGGLVALPQVTDWRQFPELNVFRRELTAVGYGLSVGFAGAAL